MRWTGKRAIPLLLAAATLLPIAALGWLGARVLQQDRAGERQRRAEDLKLAAGQLALAVEGRLADIEDQLATGKGIRFTEEGLGPGVLYQPETVPAPPIPLGLFEEAETLEFQRRDLPAAAKSYRRLAESHDPAIRAEALVRLGRVLRSRDNRSGALRVYDQLQRLGSVPVGGQPAEMIARQVRYRLSEAPGDRDEFGRALYSGVTKMDRAAFEFYRDILIEWGGPAPPLNEVARTEAAGVLWKRWKAGDLPSRGRELIGVNGVQTPAIWAGGPESPTARLMTFSELEEMLTPLGAAHRLLISFTDGPPREGTIVLTPGETRLPFLLRVSAAPGRAQGHTFGSGRTVLITGLAFTFTLMLLAAYGLYRVTTRQVALAQQQADFVSAVSHEFRTPLTSMRHLTEPLAADKVSSEQRKKQYYGLLAQESQRLHRMVESLLSFGRMEAGVSARRLESADARELLRDAVEEFRRDPHSQGREVACETDENLPPIRADREALSRAVSNLLDNAGKYSEPDTPIRVSAKRDGGSIHISVEDQGPAIPLEEQKKLFDRFVRGDEARRSGARGIGVGLALVKSVVEAHGGTVRLTAEPGRGNTFTLMIPCQET